MRRGWRTKTLEETCQFSNGLWKGEKPPFVKVGVIRNTNFTKEGTLDDSDIAYLDVEVKKLEKRRLQLGDIILEKSGGGPKQPVGRVALFDKDEGDFSFSNFTAALRVLEPSELDYRFLHKFLHWTYVSGVTEGMQSNSTGIRNLDGDAYKGIEITFPPLAEQQRIVGLLDEAFKGLATAKANAEKNLQNARTLFQVLVNQLLDLGGNDWKQITFGDVVTQSRGGISIKSSEYSESGIPVLTKGDIKPFGRIEHGGKYVEEAQVIKQRWPVADPGDLIVATRDLKSSAPFLGLVSRVPKDRPYVVNQGATYFKINESLVVPDYFVYWCCCARYRAHVVAKKSGATQVHIREGDLFSAPLSLPPVKDQRLIIAKLDDLHEETQRLVGLYESKLAALEVLKKSLLHQAFTGRLQ